MPQQRSERFQNTTVSPVLCIPTPFSEVLIHTYASTCAHIYPTCGPIVYPLCTGLCVIVYCILLLYYMYTDVPDHGLKRSIK